MAEEIMGEMRKSGNSKLNEILRRSRGEAEMSSDTPDIYFDYKDSDTYQGEMAELYSYTEEEDFVGNKDCFLLLLYQQYPEGTLWWSLSDLERKNEVFRLVDLLEVANKEIRSRAVRALLYLLQGTFAECTDKPKANRAATSMEVGEEDGGIKKNKEFDNTNNTNNNNDAKGDLNNSKNEDYITTTNSLYKSPTTTTATTTPPKSTTTTTPPKSTTTTTPPKTTTTIPPKTTTTSSLDEHTSHVVTNTIILYNCGVFQACTQLLNMEINSNSCPTSSTISLSDNKDLRFLISILYTMLETIRFELTPELTQLKDDLKSDLVTCLSSLNESSLILTLLSMVTQFCEPQPCHYPVKKVLLLLWKSMLLTLGGLDDAFSMKNDKRAAMGLPLLTENPHEVCRGMRASSPPASAADLIEQHQQHRRGGRGALRKQAASRQSSLEDGMDGMMGNQVDEDGMDGMGGLKMDGGGMSDDDGLPPTPPRPASPQPAKGLPWAPKVRKRDLELFLEQTRSKFVGFHVNGDVTSLFGLPHPIHEGVEVFNQRLYVSLSEIQMKQEEDLAKNPLSMSEGDVEETASESLYQAIYQALPQYNIALLKILLAAAPTSKAKSDNVNILADLLPEKMPSSVLHSMKLGIDVNRHKEVIVKAVSALLIILLKHFKINHFYQFEFMAQHLVFANCIPLVLKFLNQNILAHVCAKNNISIIDYPFCVIGDPPELNADSLEAGDNEDYCWRNLFSSINLLRVLNKITKWKHSRIMMLVVFKSAPILKRALKVRHPMHQMYVLKLLKMQTKYLGRQWRKSNMKSMSAIYQKVRHRLNDDWAYGNDVDARPWDFQAEECVARSAIDQFNNRRYHSNNETKESSANNNSGVSTPPSILNDFTPVDNCLQSVLSHKVVLSRQFEENYEDWLECEVFANKIDWNQFLVASAVKN